MEKTKTDTNQQMQVDFDWKFQASMDLVFDILTRPEHLKHWHSPNHLDITYAESNLEVGGEYRIGMTSKGGEGPEMMFIGKYLEINRPDLLSYTQAFSMGKDGPLTPETKITIRLKQQGDQTLMHFNQTGFGDIQSLEGARMSWPEIYGKMGKYLESL